MLGSVGITDESGCHSEMTPDAEPQNTPEGVPYSVISCRQGAQ